MKKFMRQFRYGQGGFTLIELLVVIAILGVLAAVAIPNVGTFMGRGKTQAAQTELHNVQTATMAAMAEAEVGTITADDFGDIDQNQSTPGEDLAVSGNVTVGQFIVAGVDSVQGNYTIDTDGSVSQVEYPGL